MRRKLEGVVEAMRLQQRNAEQRLRSKEAAVQHRIEWLQAEGARKTRLNLLTIERAERELRKRIGAAALRVGTEQVQHRV